MGGRWLLRCCFKVVLCGSLVVAAVFVTFNSCFCCIVLIVDFSKFLYFYSSLFYFIVIVIIIKNPNSSSSSLSPYFIIIVIIILACRLNLCYIRTISFFLYLYVMMSPAREVSFRHHSPFPELDKCNGQEVRGQDGSPCTRR